MVTGGTDGIGKEIALGLARARHEVIIVGHDTRKGYQAALEIRQASGNRRVEFLPADLSLMSETEGLAETVTHRFSELHYLVNNAGIVPGQRHLTSEGIETSFALNYLSRFVLIRKLLPLLISSGRRGAAARIILISGAATKGGVHFDDVNLTRNFGMLRAVGQFCRANDLFTIELARRLRDRGLRSVTVNCLKLGVVKTSIRRNFPWWMKWLVPLVLDPVIGLTAAEAAKPALQMLLGAEFEDTTGSLFVKVTDFKRMDRFARALDQREGKRVWDLSERIAGWPEDP